VYFGFERGDVPQFTRTGGGTLSLSDPPPAGRGEDASQVPCRLDSAIDANCSNWKGPAAGNSWRASPPPAGKNLPESCLLSRAARRLTDAEQNVDVRWRAHGNPPVTCGNLMTPSVQRSCYGNRKPRSGFD
jgi:hypothetical protein